MIKQMSFDDLLWGNRPDKIPPVCHKEPVNEHQIKSYQNGQGTRVFCCQKCGMWFTEYELHTGSYDHHCNGYRTYGPSGTPLQEVKVKKKLCK